MEISTAGFFAVHREFPQDLPEEERRWEFEFLYHEKAPKEGRVTGTYTVAAEAALDHAKETGARCVNLLP